MCMQAASSQQAAAGREAEQAEAGPASAAQQDSAEPTAQQVSLNPTLKAGDFPVVTLCPASLNTVLIHVTSLLDPCSLCQAKDGSNK